VNPKDSMTLEEAARVLNLAPEKIVPLLQSGEIPATLVEGKWQVSRAGFEGWRLNTAGLGSVLRGWGTSSGKEGDSLSLGEAAKLLQTTPEKVDALARKGALPGFSSQGQWKFSRGAVEAYLKKNPPGGGAVPQAWQSQKKSGAPGAPLAAAARDVEHGVPQRRGVPAPKLVNEPVMTTPASLEMDLSILDRLEIPEPDDEPAEDE
jgi:excisionase family DNA binding protein